MTPGATPLRRGDRAVGADDAGDVGAVAVAVIRHGVRVRHRLVGGALRVGVVVVPDEVGAGHDPCIRERVRSRLASVAAEVLVVDVDTRVHDGDLDAGPGVSGRLREVSARHLDRGRQLGIRRLLGPKCVDAGRIRVRDAADPRELARVTAVDANRHALEQALVREALRVLQTDRLRLLAERVGRAIELDEIDLGGLSGSRRCRLVRRRRRNRRAARCEWQRACGCYSERSDAPHPWNTSHVSLPLFP